MSKNKFDPEELKKNIINATIQHPLTLFPAGAGFLSGLSFALFGGTATAGMAAAGLVVAASAGLYNYFGRKEYFTQKYVQHLQDQMKKEREKIIDDIDDELETMVENNQGEAKDHAEQCMTQLHMSQEKFQAFIEILDRKLNRGELTYNKFLISAEHTYLGLLDNLKKVVEIFAGIKAIDLVYIEKRLKAMQKQTKMVDADHEEKAQLEKRKDLYNKGLDEINELITENEKALTIMGEAMFAISKVKMMKGNEDVPELKDALNNLEEIARNSEIFSVDK
jgi:hypothetical protein